MNHKAWDTSGYQGKQEHIRELKIEPQLETIENIYSDRTYHVKLQTEEFSSICPKTGLPDFAILEIDYIPDEFLVEEKSLKLYLNAYRDLGIFQEHAINKIRDDFIEKIKPKKLSVTAYWNPRGGIGVEVKSSWPDD